MADIEFKITGLAGLITDVEGAPALMHTLVAAALYQFAEEVMADSKQVVPVLTGALMNTGKVEAPVDDGRLITVMLGYGDESTPYALYVHEELQSPSGNPINWTRPGSGPKYLSNPLQAKQDELPGRVRDAVVQAFR